MDIKVPHSLNWKVKLSNGEEFIEGVAPFDFLPDVDSPWLRLQEYLKEKELKIVYLAIKNGTQVFNLPYQESNPRFKKFEERGQPTDFNFFRIVAKEIPPKRRNEGCVVIEATYPDYILQLWVDDFTKHVWCVVK